VNSEESPCATLGSPQRTQICAVIVTYNIGEAIRRCFDSIQNQVGHVVIVDNGSDELTRRELHRLATSDSVTIVLNERNEGIARAFNQAVQWARGKGFKWILTLDHDSEATPGMVDRLVQAYLTLQRQGIHNVGVVGANPFDQNTKVFIRGRQPREGGGMPLEDGDVMSSGSLIQSQVFDVVGLFNEDLFVYYVDVDFCLRLARGGFRVFLCPEAVLLHKEGSREPRKFFWRKAFYDRCGKHARYYLTRNTIYMMKKHDLPPGLTYYMIRRICRDHVKILLYDKERFSVLWFSLRGLADAFRGRYGPLNSVNTTNLPGS
jgi:rhamnosyltransferase